MYIVGENTSILIYDEKEQLPPLLYIMKKERYYSLLIYRYLIQILIAFGFRQSYLPIIGHLIIIYCEGGCLRVQFSAFEGADQNGFYQIVLIDIHGTVFCFQIDVEEARHVV